MQFLRATAYTPVDQLTVVVSCDDLAITPEAYKQHMKGVPGPAFIAFDLFDFDGDLAAATAEAMKRMAARTRAEQDQAIGYHWNGEMLSHARAMLMNPAPAPLTVEQMTDMLEQLAEHPNYAGQLVTTCVVDDDNNATVFEMKDGSVTAIKRGAG